MKINTSRRVVRSDPRFGSGARSKDLWKKSFLTNNSSSNGRADACWGPVTTLQADQ